MKRSTSWALLIAGLLGLVASVWVGLWAAWASATPVWETHAEAITQRYYLAILAAVAATGLLSTGAIGLWKARKDA